MNQNELVLKYMMEHNGITQLEAARDLLCFRLSARIYDLRSMGYEIVTQTEKNSRTKTTFTRYKFGNREKVLLAQIKARLL